MSLLWELLRIPGATRAYDDHPWAMQCLRRHARRAGRWWIDGAGPSVRA